MKKTATALIGCFFAAANMNTVTIMTATSTDAMRTTIIILDKAQRNKPHSYREVILRNTDERLKKKKERLETTQRKVVGAVGFEPTTSCSQGRHANQAALRPDGVMNYVSLIYRIFTFHASFFSSPFFFA